MSCNSCRPLNPCNNCKAESNCEQRLTIDWVPNTACTVGVTLDGITDTLELREGIQNCETNTHMTFNTDTGCIEYQNERYISSDGSEGYKEIICASEIAKYINLEDLANVEDEAPENCALLIYHADDTCGAGCQGIHDSWVHWYANEHLTDGLHFVAGFNDKGCLEALDVPANVDEYWFGMWRPDKKFGYIQPEESELPTDENGNPIVMGVGPDGKPIVGPINLSCMFTNIVSNLATNIDYSWRVIQQTPGFDANVNLVNGDFTLTWNDWISDKTIHVGTGVVHGKLNWTVHFDVKTGNVKYVFHSVYYDRVDYQEDVHHELSPAYLTIKSLTFGTSHEVMILDHMQSTGRGRTWTEMIQRTVDANDYTITVAPGQKVGPIDFCYIWVDWVDDDEGYLQLTFGNKLTGWNNC